MSKITKKDLEKMSTETLAPAVRTALPNSVFMTAEDFLRSEGESYGGLNFLQLAVGQAAGPFTITKIEHDFVASKKIKGTTSRYSAKTADGLDIGLPLATSFVDKAKSADLGVGDAILIMRGNDYESEKGRKDCHSYSIKITKRAK